MKSDTQLKELNNTNTKPLAGSVLPEGRSMPESLAAEAAVLGSMIIDPESIAFVVEQLKNESFYRLENQLIFDALVILYEKNHGQGIDAVCLRDELEKRGQLDQCGGVEYIGRIMDSVPSSANVEYYTGIVKDKQLLREIVSTATDILNDAYDPMGAADEKIDQAEKKLFAITNKRLSGTISELKDLVFQAYEAIEKRDGSLVTGLSTGFYQLDDITCGLQKGELLIVAGRPSMGKTAFALNIAEHIGVREKKPVAIFSLEMSKEQLAERILCSNSRVDAQAVRRGRLDTEHYNDLVKACGELSEAPIYIDDTAGLTPLELRGKARRLKSRYDISLLVVDYLQLMNSGSSRTDSRQQEITTISRYLKGLARELSIPVMVLSQLNRSSEARDGHKPRMSDLRESGSIEQDADVVMLLHRDDYYKRTEEDFEPTNKAEVIIAKQRNGPTGVVELMFMERLARFENVASGVQEPF